MLVRLKLPDVNRGELIMNLKVCVSIYVVVLGLGCLPTIAGASESHVVKVVITKSSGGEENRYDFSVTVEHADTGWDHYADKWEIVGPDGTVLGTRILAHPHVNEQPFTRSLGNVHIPPDVEEVEIRSSDNINGGSGQTRRVEIPR